MTLLHPSDTMSLDHLLEGEDASEVRQRRTAELERANAELRHVIEVIAHDLRQPLAVVSGYAHHLEQGRSTSRGRAEVRQLADGILRGCAELDALLASAMAYAQATGACRDRTLVAVAGAASAAWWNVQPVAEERGGTLSVRELPLVPYDPIQLRQVFQNLFVNALTYVGAGVAPAIEVSAERGATGWVIAVRDNGIGMSDAALGAPLRRPHRSHPSAGRSGSGLGLLITRRIVERHGGHLAAAPAPGGGTIVTFDVPDDPQDPTT